MKIARIVVGTDGSPEAAAAVAVAGGLAEPSGAEVVVVHARGLLDRLHEGGVAAPASDVESEWTAPLAEAGIAHRVVVRDGNPVDVLLDLAADVGADLIVVGRRGVGGYPELLLGSTSTQVAQQAHCPVVITPPRSPGPAGQRDE